MQIADCSRALQGQCVVYEVNAHLAHIWSYCICPTELHTVGYELLPRIAAILDRFAVILGRIAPMLGRLRPFARSKKKPPSRLFSVVNEEHHVHRPKSTHQILPQRAAVAPLRPRPVAAVNLAFRLNAPSPSRRARLPSWHALSSSTIGLDNQYLAPQPAPRWRASRAAGTSSTATTLTRMASCTSSAPQAGPGNGE